VTDPSRPLLVWVDAQIPPAATRWIDDPGLVQAIHVSDLGLATAEDAELFEKARTAGSRRGYAVERMKERLAMAIVCETC
jgi:hypothetical protein